MRIHLRAAQLSKRLKHLQEVKIQKNLMTKMDMSSLSTMISWQMKSISQKMRTWKKMVV
jgi:hypothetical protein